MSFKQKIVELASNCDESEIRQFVDSEILNQEIINIDEITRIGESIYSIDDESFQYFYNHLFNDIKDESDINDPIVKICEKLKHKVKWGTQMCIDWNNWIESEGRTCTSEMIKEWEYIFIKFQSKLNKKLSKKVLNFIKDLEKFDQDLPKEERHKQTPPDDELLMFEEWLWDN